MVADRRIVRLRNSPHVRAAAIRTCNETPPITTGGTARPQAEVLALATPATGQPVGLDRAGSGVKQPRGEASSPSSTDPAFEHDAALRPAAVRDGCLLDRVAVAAVQCDDKRRVVEISPCPVVEPRGDGLERPAIEPHGVTARTTWQPVEID